MLDRLIEEAWAEEADESWLLDVMNTVAPAVHAAGVVWRDMMPAQKAHLIELAKSTLRQLREDPRALLSRTLQMANWLIANRQLPPPQAVKQAAQQVARQRKTKRLSRSKGKVKGRNRAKSKRKAIRQKRRRGGNRFELWV